MKKFRFRINKRKTIQNLKMKKFIFNIQNRSQKLSNYSYTKNYVITERTGEMDVIKLKNWDKENLIHIQQDSDILYASLSNLYNKTKNYSKLQRLESYHKIIETSNGELKKILKNKSKNSRNKVFESFIKQNQEQQGLILLNNIVKTKNKFNLGSMENKKQRQMAQSFGFESQALNTVAEKNMDSQFYRRIIKEKVNQENYSRHELMNVTLQYMEKKKERTEKESQLSKIFVDIYNLTSSFNEKKNKIKIDIINLQDSLDKMKRDSKISKEESMLIVRQKALERNQMEKKVKELYKN